MNPATSRGGGHDLKTNPTGVATCGTGGCGRTNTNVEHGTIGFVPSICSTADSEVLTVEPGKRGVRVFKQVDSEAAVTEPLTWESIAKLEPEVLVLLDEIKTERPNEHNYFSIWRKYKERLSELVGWSPEATTYPQLRSSAAYNVVYHKLLDNLKDPE
jgi:hypothetical protein